MKIKKIIGDISYDDRGFLVHNNNFDFNKIRRFYIIKNDSKNFVRAWHGHKKESKYFLCIEGKFRICLVKINDFKNPSKKLKILSFILDSNKSEILQVPPGYANGTINLLEGSKLMVFSNMKLSQSIKDDYRYPHDYWNPWKIKNR